jgi:putative alpha-1,2-mannosidase
MVSPGPVNDFGMPSGYRHGADSVEGFSFLHLSGTGCGDLGNVLVTLMRGDSIRNPRSFRARIVDERASPGYYSARLPDVGLVVEATATLRTGLLRITSAGGTGPLHILVDAGRNLGGMSGGTVSLRPPDSMTGTCISGGFCGDPISQDVFFAARLSLPAASYGVWAGDVRSEELEASAPSGSVGGYFTIRKLPKEGVVIRVGVSYVSVANAAENLAAESNVGEFEAVRQAAALARRAFQGRSGGRLPPRQRGVLHGALPRAHPSRRHFGRER